MTREEAINELKNMAKFNYTLAPLEVFDMAIKALEQEPKTGYREYNDIYDHYLCGNCKKIVMDYDNYCPNCGVRMESEE